MPSDPEALPPLIDIGANLLDPQYRGEYRGKPRHAPDLDAVLARGWAAGVRSVILTAGSLSDSKDTLELARTDPRLFCTVGVHPTRCDEFEADPEAHAAALLVVASGPCNSAAQLHH